MYIDSTKVFDVLMVDVYFINKMLKVNGILVLDDCDFPSIRFLARFLAVHTCFRIYAVLNKDKVSKKMRFLKFVSHAILKLIPFKKKRVSKYRF